jgi:hypothetical protein
MEQNHGVCHAAPSFPMCCLKKALDVTFDRED